MRSNSQPDYAIQTIAARKRRIARVGPDNNDYAVLMTIRVASSDLAVVRRVLHQLLGPNLNIYTAVIDNKRGNASLQVELASRRVDSAMRLIMSALPEAEFGSIRPSPRTLTH